LDQKHFVIVFRDLERFSPRIRQRAPRRQQLRLEKRRTTVAILQVVSSTVAPSKSPHWLQNSTPPAGPDFIPYKANQHRSDANTRYRKH
jgi:hypothetical protein